MLGLLLGLLMTNAHGIVIENQCAAYSVNSKTIRKISLEKKECIEKFYDLDSPVNFFIEGNKGKYISLTQKNENIEFCTIPADIISEVDGVAGKKKVLWNSSKNFMDVLQSTVFEEAIKRNNDASNKNNINTCYAFPGFNRIKKFGKNLLPESLKELNNGGYVVLSSRIKSVIFFDTKVDKILHSFETPEKSIVRDVLFTANGDFYVLSEPLNMDKIPLNLCLQKWDLGTGTMMTSFCNIKNYKNQILIEEDGKVMHLFVTNGTMSLETTDPVRPVVQASISGIEDFKLEAAFLRDEDTKNTATEKHAPQGPR